MPNRRGKAHYYLTTTENKRPRWRVLVYRAGEGVRHLKTLGYVETTTPEKLAAIKLRYGITARERQREEEWQKTVKECAEESQRLAEARQKLEQRMVNAK